MFFFGDRHIQSQLPLNGYAPEVSIKVLIFLLFKPAHNKSRFHISGSPPVTTTESAPESITRPIMTLVSINGCRSGFQEKRESHQEQPMSHHPNLIKYAAFPV